MTIKTFIYYDCVPYYMINETYQDFLKKRDVFLDKTLEIIAESE